MISRMPPAPSFGPGTLVACDCLFVVADLRLLAGCRLLAAGAGQAEGWQGGFGGPGEGPERAPGRVQGCSGIAPGEPWDSPGSHGMIPGGPGQVKTAHEPFGVMFSSVSARLIIWTCVFQCFCASGAETLENITPNRPGQVRTHPFRAVFWGVGPCGGNLKGGL